jgi:decaprenylphospho-beta-D-erythro-pentofuranosid-2-ulose 2-reductase
VTRVFLRKCHEDLWGIEIAMNTKKRIIIVGATSAIAEHCSRLWVNEAPVDLTLIGRNKTKIERVAQDLHTRSPHSIIRVLEADFFDPSKIQDLADHIAAEGNIDIVLIAHGSLPDQQASQMNLTMCRDALMVNALSPTLFAEGFAGHMEKAGSGTLAMIGSVAGDRGRKSIYIYGSAKALIETYTQGLQHRFANSKVKIVLVKPGPTNTPMAAHLGQSYKLASVEEVAKLIVQGIKQGKPIIYAPKKWAFIMAVIRNLPWFIFKRLEI